jgi:prophage antirepressor-like protein
MNELQVFDFKNFKIQIFLDDYGNPWFYAYEVCAILEIKNTAQAVSRLSADDKSTIIINDSKTNNPKRTIINEYGLYDLVLVSRTKMAKEFKYWITHEVLPNIRKTGNYSLFEKDIPKTLPDALEKYAAALREKEEYKQLSEQQESRILELKPKADYTDAIIESDQDIEISHFAKRHDSKPKILFQFLRINDILIKSGANYNLPRQVYINRGYFTTSTKPWEKETKSGMIKRGTHTKTMVTPKGQVWLRNWLVKAGFIDQPELFLVEAK